MKKAILTLGLFSMIMVLTSFTTPASNINVDVTHKSNFMVFNNEPGGGGQQVPASKGLEVDNEPGGNGQQVPLGKKTL